MAAVPLSSKGLCECLTSTPLIQAAVEAEKCAKIAKEASHFGLLAGFEM